MQFGEKENKTSIAIRVHTSLSFSPDHLLNPCSEDNWMSETAIELISPRFTSNLAGDDVGSGSKNKKAINFQFRA